MPERVQLSRRAGWRMPENTVKVDRSTKWGNPFRKMGSPLCIVDAFEAWLLGGYTTDAFDMALAARAELRGKNLACWCRLDAKCHADVLLRVANEENCMTTITSKGIFCPRTGAAGWAARVESAEKRTRDEFFSAIDGDCFGPTEAELVGMQSALAWAIDNAITPRMSRVEFVTNCRECVAVLLAKIEAARILGPDVIGPAKKITARLSDCQALLDLVRLVRTNNLAVVFRLAPIDREISTGAGKGMAQRRQSMKAA